MSWKDRLRTMYYTAPESGDTFELLFEQLSRSGGKKAPVTEFPGQDESSVQDLGNETITLPIRCYISGPDYDTLADRFWDALAEPGFGTLEHPRWGNLTVLPSTREQTEQFVDGAGRAVFQIDFLRISEAAQEFPRISRPAYAESGQDVEAAGESIQEQLSGVEITDPNAIEALKNNVLDTVGGISSAFDSATNQVDGLAAEIDAQVREITGAIDSLATAPADLMDSLLTLFRIPARTAATVESKLDGYRTTYETLAEGFNDTIRLYGETFGLIATTQASAVAAAAAESTVDGPVPTRGSAARSVDQLTSLDSDIREFISEVEQETGTTAQNGEQFFAGYSVHAHVSRAVSRAVGSLIDRALSLPTERVRVLESSVTPIMLAWEIFGDSEHLDFIIDYNGLSGDEIFRIPAGREVRWYV